MATYYVYSGAVGTGTGASWANAFTTLTAALSGKAAGDVFYIAHDHAESTAGAVTLTSPGTAAAPCYFYCANRAGTVPPVSADLRTTATVATSAANVLTVNGFAYFYGVQFTSGSGATAVNMALGSAAGALVFDNCKLILGGTNTGNRMQFGGSSVATRAVLKNTTVKFGATAQGISVNGTDFRWENTASAIDTGGSAPAQLFFLTVNPPRLICEGVDLSAITGTIFGAASQASKALTLKDCKLGAAATILASQTGVNAGAAELLRCDSGTAAYRNEKYNALGSQVMETTITKTSGGSINSQALSANITTSSQAAFAYPFEGLPLTIGNLTTGVAKTVTVEGVWNAAALPNNDEFWIEVEHLGSSASPLGSFVSGAKADGLASGSALTASTTAWGANVTARANTTAYTLGQVRKVASNSGRIFFCTTAGTSAGSEPAGYATAVDGGSVTDGTAVFRAGVRFKQTLTFTPQMAGAVFVQPKAGKASATFYIDLAPALA